MFSRVVLAGLLLVTWTACGGVHDDPFGRLGGDSTSSSEIDSSSLQISDPLLGDSCESDTLNSDFRQFFENFFLPARTDLLPEFVDLDTMIQAVEFREDGYRQATGPIGLAMSTIECSFFQLGLSERVVLYEGELETSVEAAIQDNRPMVGLSLGVAGAKWQSLPCELVRALIDQTEDNLSLALQSQESVLAQLVHLHRYVYFTRLFRVERDLELLTRALDLVEPVPGEWESDLSLASLLRLESRVHLGLPPERGPASVAVSRAWDGSSFSFSDCPQEEDECRLKSIQVIAIIENSVQFLAQDLMAEMAEVVVSGIDEDGDFGHPEQYGLDPDLMWGFGACDWVCEVSHWAYAATLNTVLNRLEDPLGDLAHLRREDAR